MLDPSKPPTMKPSPTGSVKIDYLEDVEGPIDMGSYLIVKAFTLSPDRRRSHVLVPARDIKQIPTGLAVNFGETTLPLISTPDNLRELRLETVGFNLIEKQLFITIQSFRHDSFNISNGTPIALFHFATRNNVKVELPK